MNIIKTVRRFLPSKFALETTVRVLFTLGLLAALLYAVIVYTPANHMLGPGGTQPLLGPGGEYQANTIATTYAIVFAVVIALAAAAMIFSK